MKGLRLTRDALGGKVLSVDTERGRVTNGHWLVSADLLTLDGDGPLLDQLNRLMPKGYPNAAKARDLPDSLIPLPDAEAPAVRWVVTALRTVPASPDFAPGVLLVGLAHDATRIKLGELDARYVDWLHWSAGTPLASTKPGAPLWCLAAPPGYVNAEGPVYACLMPRRDPSITPFKLDHSEAKEILAAAWPAPKPTIPTPPAPNLGVAFALANGAKLPH